MKTPYDAAMQLLRDMDMKVDREGNLRLDLFYPRNDDHIRAVVLGLSDVRAADEVRLSYDFDRDGWKVEQASVFEWDAGDQVCDPGWVEVAFVKAWASERKNL